MHPSYGSAPSLAARRVRALWADFESWAETQRKLMERKREEIAKNHDSNWKRLPAKNRTRPDEHDAQKAKLLRDLVERHITNAQEEWQSRLAKNNLVDHDWGELTFREQQQIEKILGGGDLELDSTPSIPQNVLVQPQYSTVSIPPDAVPPPPISPTSRIFNTSASTTSSYTLVNPNEFSTDDEYYEPGSSYIVPTDESDDEQFSAPARGQFSNRSPRDGSPERSGSSSSAHDDFFSTHSLPVKNDTPNSAPHPKRSSDVTIDRKGKSRVRGPTYVGPRLSDPEESSEEEEFELFKMQTRVTKIWEFHLAAARHGVELAMTIQNNRMTGKSSGKADDAFLVEAHEKQMLTLQTEKEEERKGIVAAERNKRREAIRKRSILVDTGRAANAATTDSVDQQEWEDTFKKGQSVHLDPKRKRFVIGKDDPYSQSDENPAWETPLFEPASDLRTPTLPGSQDTIRAQRQSLNRATPSGWTMKTFATSATVSPQQQDNEPPTSSSNPDLNAVPSWMEEAFSGTALDTSFGGDDYEIPGSFPDASSSMSTSVPPIPSGWGPQKPTSSPAATGLLRKALTNHTLPAVQSPATAMATKNKTSPLSDPQPKANTERPNSIPPTTTASTSNTKKQTKKGRQAANQKKGGGGSATTVEEEEQPTGTTDFPGMVSVVAQSINVNGKSDSRHHQHHDEHHFSVSPKDILQRQQRFSTQASEDELSTTPRPQHLNMKRAAAGGMTLDYVSDAAPTPRVSAKRLAEFSVSGMRVGAGAGAGTGTGVGVVAPDETPWQRSERLKRERAGASTLSSSSTTEMVGNGWGHVSPMEAMMKEEESQETVWQRAQRLKTQQGAGQGQLGQGHAQAQVQAQAPLLPKSVQRLQEEFMWERQAMSQSAAAGPSSRASTSAVPVPPTATGKPSPFGHEENTTLWQRNMMTKNQHAYQQQQQQQREEETVWNQVMGRTQLGEHQQPSSSMTSVAVSMQHQQQQSESEETPWGRMMRRKAGVEQQASEKQQRPEPEKTPWEHAMGSKSLSGASSSKSAFNHPSPTVVGMQSTKPSWSGTPDHDHLMSKLVQQQQQQHLQQPSSAPPPAAPFWSPNGATNMGHSQMWNSNKNEPQLALGGGRMKGGMTTREAAGKRVTVEEVPDEDGPVVRKAGHQRLPSNSRAVLDIAEPKPSAPATMFADIINYGEEEEEEEYDAGWGSSAPTPSTAPTSPPNDVPSLDDEEWLKAAAENAKNGNWDALLNGSGGGGGGGVPIPSKGKQQQQQQSSRWPINNSSAVKQPNNSDAQMLDSAELFSALQSVEPPARVTPPKSTTAPMAKPSSSIPTTAPPPAPKTKIESAAAAAPSAPPTTAPEKPESATKPTNQQNQNKAKGKGKGKGRK